MFAALCQPADRFEVKKDVIMGTYILVFQVLTSMIGRIVPEAVPLSVDVLLGCQVAAT